MGPERWFSGRKAPAAKTDDLSLILRPNVIGEENWFLQISLTFACMPCLSGSNMNLKQAGTAHSLHLRRAGIHNWPVWRVKNPRRGASRCPPTITTSWGGPEKWACLLWGHWGAADYFIASIRLSGAVTVLFTFMPLTPKFLILFPQLVCISQDVSLVTRPSSRALICA